MVEEGANAWTALITKRRERMRFIMVILICYCYSLENIAVVLLNVCSEMEVGYEELWGLLLGGVAATEKYHGACVIVACFQVLCVVVVCVGRFVP